VACTGAASFAAGVLSLFGAGGGRHPARLFLLLAHYARVDNRLANRLAARLDYGLAPATFAPHAGYDRRARGFPAFRNDLLVGGGKNGKD
jgi:hypothetical protein